MQFTEGFSSSKDFTFVWRETCSNSVADCWWLDDTVQCFVPYSWEYCEVPCEWCIFSMYSSPVHFVCYRNLIYWQSNQEEDEYRVLKIWFTTRYSPQCNFLWNIPLFGLESLYFVLLMLMKSVCFCKFLENDQHKKRHFKTYSVTYWMFEM